MIKILLTFVTAMLLISCGQNRKIDYTRNLDTTSVANDGIKDTTKLLVSELPIKFDSTDILLFAVEQVDLQERGGYSKVRSAYYGSAEIATSYFSTDHLIGNFVNIVFKDKSGHEQRLTNKRIKIRSVTYLRDIAKQTKVGYLLYSISDRDSNADRELNNSDLEALYISNIDGSGFTKLTQELHDFFDWSSIKGESRIYFRTLEDKNRDGILNNRDKFHYYFIDFENNKYSVTEYNPLKIFE